jgi:hypothetical protein
MFEKLKKMFGAAEPVAPPAIEVKKTSKKKPV